MAIYIHNTRKPQTWPQTTYFQDCSHSRVTTYIFIYFVNLYYLARDRGQAYADLTENVKLFFLENKTRDPWATIRSPDKNSYCIFANAM